MKFGVFLEMLCLEIIGKYCQLLIYFSLAYFDYTSMYKWNVITVSLQPAQTIRKIQRAPSMNTQYKLIN